MEYRENGISITDYYQGPSMPELTSYSDDMSGALQWRRSKKASYLKLTQRRRYLYEQRNDHLIQLDLQDAALIAERKKSQIMCLAYAAQIEKQLDPSTRDMVFEPAKQNNYRIVDREYSYKQGGLGQTSPSFENRSKSVFQSYNSPSRGNKNQYNSVFNREPLGNLRSPKPARISSFSPKNNIQFRSKFTSNSKMGRSPLKEQSDSLNSNNSAFFPLRENKFTPMHID